jgi:hypothetical protein
LKEALQKKASHHIELLKKKLPTQHRLLRTPYYCSIHSRLFKEKLKDKEPSYQTNRMHESAKPHVPFQPLSTKADNARTWPKELTGKMTDFFLCSFLQTPENKKKTDCGRCISE